MEKMLSAQPNTLRRACKTDQAIQQICESAEFQKQYRKKWGLAGLRWAIQRWPSKFIVASFPSKQKLRDLDTIVNENILKHVGHNASQARNIKYHTRKYSYRSKNSNIPLAHLHYKYTSNNKTRIQLYIFARYDHNNHIEWKHIDLKSDYTLIKKLGEGGFGEVWLANPKGKKKTYLAIKLISYNRKKEVEKRELAAWKRLSYKPNCHKYVVCLYDYGFGIYKGAKKIILVMEYLTQGSTLAEFAKNGLVYLPSPETLHHLLKELVQGLRFIHQHNVYHRDIKTENIMVQPNMDLKTAREQWSYPDIKYIDVGLSCVKGTEPCQAPSGTPEYVDPRLAKRALDIQHGKFTNKELEAADIWALAVSLYEITMLQHPSFDLVNMKNMSPEDIFLTIINSPIRSFEYPIKQLDDITNKQKKLIKKLNLQITSLVDPDIDKRIKNFNSLEFE